MAGIIIIILIGIGWIIVKAFEGAGNVSSAIKSKQSFNNERVKYGNRIIDFSKSLFGRNIDIINEYLDNASQSTSSYRYYHTDNVTRDCINEICLAENQIGIRPNGKYLSDWKRTVPKEWVDLSEQIKSMFEKRESLVRTEQNRLISEKNRIVSEKASHENKLRTEERMIRKVRESLQYRKRQREEPMSVQEIEQIKSKGDIHIDDVNIILTPNTKSWSEREKELIADRSKGQVVKFPTFKSEIDLRSAKELNAEIEEFNKQLEIDAEAGIKNSKFFEDIFSGYKKNDKDSVISRINLIVDGVDFPKAIPKVWNVDFDPIESIAIVELMLPDVVHHKIYKKVTLKKGVAQKELNQKEIKEHVPNIHPAIILRIAYEIFRNDISNKIKLLVLNGWVEFDDPSTGVKTRTYTASLVSEKDKIVQFNLSKLEPLSAFMNLKGKSAGKLIDIIPVTPVMSLSRKDKRFIETKQVLSKLGSETNLASMDWQDFESLIAELFEKEFASEGAEVKVTQASRDRGVDAVVFIPDPIKGGKYIIQAKRYTHTVDVSAVRDLCAVVKKEGASKGILVTTSTYGSDAYAFAQNEPITLLNGAELLGLLNKHNYKFRINLAEARKLYSDSQIVKS